MDILYTPRFWYGKLYILESGNNSRMKKLFVWLLIFTLMTLCLTSCSSEEKIMDKLFTKINSPGSILSANERSLANARFDQILYACKKQDVITMKTFFSNKVIDETGNINDRIAELFNFFEGEVLSYDDWGGPGSDMGINEDNTNRTWKRLRSTYDVKTDKQRYRFAIEEFILDTANQNNIGISSIYIIKAENSDMQFAYLGDGKWTPGINIIKE